MKINNDIKPAPSDLTLYHSSLGPVWLTKKHTELLEQRLKETKDKFDKEIVATHY